MDCLIEFMFTVVLQMSYPFIATFCVVVFIAVALNVEFIVDFGIL